MDATTADISWSIPVGAPVHDRTDHKVGHVVSGDGDGLVVGRGFLIITDFTIPYDWVDRYEDGRIILNVTEAQMVGDEPVDP